MLKEEAFVAYIDNATDNLWPDSSIPGEILGRNGTYTVVDMTLSHPSESGTMPDGKSRHGYIAVFTGVSVDVALLIRR